ncbi:hypothetical protein BDY19DRAFT_987755 [Irpex rosettiformis]|uniref:Uncharacterized protein n=1 Tax=Irpex rosettiformis TaxID=378272 RepID=A0ACB8TPJ1_9APHY|nr:hypothetical protein BDY19DRAFT_987755 [Irpex rosettiformis]
MVRTRQPSESGDEDVSKSKKRVEAGDDEGGTESEEEVEYEIEEIINHSMDTFGAGQIGYLVKWKGYDDSQNSWVTEEDAGNAQELIETYWKQRGGRPTTSAKKARKSDTKPKTSAVQKRKSSPAAMVVDSDEEPAPAKKRGRQSKGSVSDDEEPKKTKSGKTATKGANGSASSKKALARADEEDEDDKQYVSMQKFKNLASWDHLVHHIETVERTESGGLKVYFTLKSQNGVDGAFCCEDSTICKQKMPRTLLDFYESNLRWRQAEEA